MRSIDLRNWSRRSQYAFFRGVAHPHFSLCAEVDTTLLMAELKPAGVSVFTAALFAIARAANSVPELRMRFRGDQVVEHSVVHTSVTVPIDGGRFAFCDVEYAPDWRTFDARCRHALELAKRQTELTENVAHRDDWLYLSCLPWIAFSAMTNPTNGADDCIPRIAWGKITHHEDAWRMPVAVQVHHALVDGFHLGRFYAALQDYVNAQLA